MAGSEGAPVYIRQEKYDTFVVTSPGNLTDRHYLIATKLISSAAHLPELSARPFFYRLIK